MPTRSRRLALPTFVSLLLAGAGAAQAAPDAAGKVHEVKLDERADLSELAELVAQLSGLPPALMPCCDVPRARFSLVGPKALRADQLRALLGALARLHSAELAEVKGPHGPLLVIAHPPGPVVAGPKTAAIYLRPVQPRSAESVAKRLQEAVPDQLVALPGKGGGEIVVAVAAARLDESLEKLDALDKPLAPEARVAYTTAPEPPPTVTRAALAAAGEGGDGARIVPNYKGGKASGVKLFSIRPSSLFTQLRLRNGDILRKVNGRELSDRDATMEALRAAAAGTELTLDVERRGKEQELRATIAPARTPGGMARLDPHFRNGKPDGYMLRSVAPDSALARGGLRDGDIVKRVDGRPLEDPTKLLEMLVAGASAELELERDGRPAKLRFPVAP